MPGKELFRQDHVERSELELRWGFRLAYILFDAVIFIVLLYLCVEAALMRLENLFEMPHVLTVFFFTGLYIFASRAIYTKLFKAPMIFGLMLECGAVFVFTVVPAFLVIQGPLGLNLCWMTLWWHQLPGLMWMFLGFSPLVAVWLLIGYGAFTSQVARRRPLVPMIAVFALGALVLGQYAAIMGRGFRLVEFVLPLAATVAAFLSALRGRPRLFARSALVFFITAFAAWHIMGFLPGPGSKSFQAARGVEKLYPLSNVAAPAPASLVSDIAADPAGGMFYIAGGRSGYVMAMDTGTGGMHYATFNNADISRVETDPWTHDVFALDRAGAQVIQLAPGSLRAVTRHGIRNDWGAVPGGILPFDNQFYVTYSEYPGVAEYGTADFDMRGGIRFRPAAMATYRTGASDIAAVREDGALYAAAGAHGAKGESMIVRIDPERFVVNAHLLAPGYIRAFDIDNRDRIMYAAGYFSRRLFEIDLETMKVKRTLPGPPACSQIVYDPARDLVYAAGHYDGSFHIVDLETGRLLDSRRTCNRIRAMKLDTRKDRLCIACVNGVFRISLEEFLAGAVYE